MTKISSLAVFWYSPGLVPSAQPDIAPADQLPDLGFQLTLVFNAGPRSVDLDQLAAELLRAIS